LAEALRDLGHYHVPETYTNIVHFNLKPEAGFNHQAVLEGLERVGVLIGYADPRGFRAVTHYWVDDQALESVVAAFAALPQAVATGR
jgi:threonine aldolase